MHSYHEIRMSNVTTGLWGDRTLSELSVLIFLGVAYAVAGIGLSYGLHLSSVVFWPFLSVVLCLIVVSVFSVSSYQTQKHDVVALVGLGMLLILYILAPQTLSYLSRFAQPPIDAYVLLIVVIAAVPVIPSAIFGYETQRTPGFQAGLHGYFHGLTRYITIGVAPTMITSGFMGSMMIGRAGPPPLSEFVWVYTLFALLITGFASIGAGFGYTIGYMTGQLRSRNK